MMSNIPCEAAVDTVSLNTIIKLYNGLHRAVKKQRGSSGLCGHPPSSLDHSHHLLSFCPAIIRMRKLTHTSLPINSLCLPRVCERALSGFVYGFDISSSRSPV